MEIPVADRISSLPYNVLEQILRPLPLRDVIRTSILSREWRYKWVEVCSELVFDANVDNRLLKTIIYQVLLIHQGPLRKFSLLARNSGLFPDIAHWILFLSKKNVQEFLLRCPCDSNFHLPSHLFKFHDLRKLELGGCKFYPPPDFKAFTNLVTLNLRYVTFEPTCFQTLVSSSPYLECVTLDCCTPFDNFSVDAPALKFFKISGSTKSICFENTPLLEEIIMGPISIEISKSFAVPKPQVTLHNINQLNFKFVYCNVIQQAAYALHLISNCPNLERLRLMFHMCNSSKHVVECFIHHLRLQTKPLSALNQLKRVDVKLMLFSKLEMEFVQYVLLSATALEIICIVTCVKFSQRGMKMMEKMKQSSPNVEFIYKEVDYITFMNSEKE
ncbi:F-box/FBD/LRR-repeat protein At1g13570-like isoform X2 [Solanum dulcamara]|nr:F-box/FBD/LRR-repeat protein At1g13570-like isoform X2 [Solanum dulcamara]XP_055820820.1 F-box/FBD/LRR-repeat protein At1g13570-like isoform X2 [Solanum dulcamara]